jgi:hypothetical protein
VSKTLGIFISTPGRASLLRTLHSIAYQQAPVEDVLVVGDGYHAPTDELVSAAAEALGLPCRYIATRKTRDWGHTQQNFALKEVRGDYLVYQDDDDIFVPRALNEIARLVDAQDTPRPLIGRVKTPKLGLLWQVPGPENACLDGHCLVAPNDKRRLGWFNSEYNGDQCYIHTTLRNYKEHEWTDRVWTLARPQWKLWPRVVSTTLFTLHRELGSLAECYLHMEADQQLDLYHVWVDDLDLLTVEELQEVAEFMVYAAQGRDVSVKTRPEQHALRAALLDRGFKEHYGTEERVLVYDWPPAFWGKYEPFNQLLDEHGRPIQDWRDPIWGGRAVEEE